ncbi:MAG: hypothetical protein KC421_03845 [Anaerolineales bacterium]|nr:hypothetical protein [Anaerolineales bacterium]
MDAYQPIKLEELKNDVFNTLKKWNKQAGDTTDLLDYLLLVRQQRWEQDVVHRPTRWRLVTNQVLLDAINLLEHEDQEQAQVLKYRFVQQLPVVRVGYKMNVAEATVMRMQRSGVDNLAQILLTHEEEARIQHSQKILAKLPPSTYQKLFGVEQISDTIYKQLLPKNENWVVAVVGLGGIGKTALADYVTRKVIDLFTYDDVVWVRVDNRTLDQAVDLPRLTYEYIIAQLATRFFGLNSEPRFEQREIQVRHRLNANPHLIVVDNLENEADTAFLIDQLHELTDPSRFLLTTRSRPESETGYVAFSLDELEMADALDLMRHYAAIIGIETVMNAPNDALEDVYNIVGGNPQALKIVVSLLELVPFVQLLDNLKAAHEGGKIDALYKRIYQQAWKTLSNEARQLLKVMPLVAESGGDAAYLQMLSDLKDEVYWPAVQQLRRRSLLEVRGGLEEKQYGVHRLTETFVRHDIANWWIEDEGESG